MTEKSKVKNKPEVVAIPPRRVVRRAKVYHSAKTGRFITDKYRKQHPRAIVKETIKKK